MQNAESRHLGQARINLNISSEGVELPKYVKNEIYIQFASIEQFTDWIPTMELRLGPILLDDEIQSSAMLYLDF